MVVWGRGDPALLFLKNFFGGGDDMIKTKSIKSNDQPGRIIIKSEFEPSPPGLKESRENIVLSLIARYHIKHGRKLN